MKKNAPHRIHLVREGTVMPRLQWQCPVPSTVISLMKATMIVCSKGAMLSPLYCTALWCHFERGGSWVHRVKPPVFHTPRNSVSSLFFDKFVFLLNLAELISVV